MISDTDRKIDTVQGTPWILRLQKIKDIAKVEGGYDHNGYFKTREQI
jgi:hypothetical protein